MEESDALILPSGSLSNDDERRVPTSAEDDPISICVCTYCVLDLQIADVRVIQFAQHTINTVQTAVRRGKAARLYSPNTKGTTWRHKLPPQHIHIYDTHTSGKGRTLDHAGTATTPLLTHIDDIHGRPAAHGPRRSRRRSRP